MKALVLIFCLTLGTSAFAAETFSGVSSLAVSVRLSELTDIDKAAMKWVAFEQALAKCNQQYEKCVYVSTKSEGCTYDALSYNGPSRICYQSVKVKAVK